MNYFELKYKQRDGKDFPVKLEKLLNIIGKITNEKNMIITSYKRSAEDQARVMIENYDTNGICGLYTNQNYCKIRKSFPSHIRSIKDKGYKELYSKILDAAKKDPSRPHIQGTAIDIAPSSIKNHKNFENIVGNMVGKEIIKFLSPSTGKEKAYHIEYDKNKYK